MIHMIRDVALWGFLMLCAIGQAAQADSIDDYVQEQIKKHEIPGVAVAIVQDGKVLRAKGYGLANVELSVPATGNTVYQLASITKQFTATAIMMLVEEGKLSLDDPITKRLSDLPTAWEPITVRHLLNHTSGIKNYTGIKDFDKAMRKDFTPRQLLDLVAQEPLEFVPGAKWNYCNTGYILLGMLIEKVTDKRYGEFLEERIFHPLGMSHTRVNNLQTIIPNRAQGYSRDGMELRNGEYVSPTQPFSAGALVSTVSDMIKWDAALYTTKLLKKSSLDTMWTTTPLSQGGTADYGFGWQVESVNGHRLIGHGGGIPGFATRILRFVDDNLTVIVLSNGDNCDAGAFAQGIAGRVLPFLAKKADAPIADTEPQTTQRLTGMILDTIKGASDPDLFTEEMKQARASHFKEEQKEFARFGAFKELLLLERKAIEEGTLLRYRAVFAKETLNLTFQLDKAGKIAGVGLERQY